jgi:hypothetical protein
LSFLLPPEFIIKLGQMIASVTLKVTFVERR